MATVRRTVALGLMVCLAFVLPFSQTQKVFDTETCSDGCKTDQNCPANAHCVAVTQASDCGLCLCRNGYKTQNRECVKNNNGGSAGSSNTATTTTTSSPDDYNGGDQTEVTDAPTEVSTTNAPRTTVATTQAGPTTQGPVPTPTPLNCADYACSANIKPSDVDNPFTIRAQLYNESADCKRKLSLPGRSCNLASGGACYGEYCLKGDGANDYCICPPYRVDRQCAVDKPGKCESATGQLPKNGYKADGKRWRSKTNPDSGSVYGRHFAATLDDCVKLCQWSGGSCKSVNYGTLGGAKLCEMLSIQVTKGNLLEPWLVTASGWQHVQVV